MTSEFVHRKRYEEMMDVTHATVTNWMQKKWQRGKHYVVVGKNTFINLNEANAWLKNYQKDCSSKTDTIE
jgi:hypothetical protein